MKENHIIALFFGLCSAFVLAAVFCTCKKFDRMAKNIIGIPNVNSSDEESSIGTSQTNNGSTALTNLSTTAYNGSTESRDRVAGRGRRQMSTITEEEISTLGGPSSSAVNTISTEALKSASDQTPSEWTSTQAKTISTEALKSASDGTPSAWTSTQASTISTGALKSASDGTSSDWMSTQ